METKEVLKELKGFKKGDEIVSPDCPSDPE